MKSKKGFTLIELLIVITIIGILAVAFLPSLLGAPSKARDTQRIASLQKIATVLSTQSISGALPTTDGCISSDGKIGAGSTVEFQAADFGGQVPLDPSKTSVVASCTGTYAATGNTAGKYYYNYHKGDATYGAYSFGLYARMENAENGNIPCDAATGAIPDWDNIGGAIAGDTSSCYALLIQ